MLTKITKADKSQPEVVEIHCHKISDEVKEIVAFVKSRQGQLTGVIGDRQFEIALGDILYIPRARFTKPSRSSTNLKMY